MLTLERVRLVNWHNFEDTVVEIGNRCLLAGDNGSGKSTIIDAIQYTLAASLRMAKFNSAADERKGGGRDLMGYVRCKLGSEATEYRRGDTIAHVMLEWGSGTGGFACGVCIEAWKDNHYSEHFWTASRLAIHELPVRSDDGTPLVFRQFKLMLAEQKAYLFDTKYSYTRDLTNRLGVFKRQQQEVNPYLDTLTRSIGFKPLDSIDKFVCDYILEENPVSIQDMKQNLENYKEADRQAKSAIEKIGSLKKICGKAAEWRNYDGLILKQEFLKLRIELENEKQNKEKAVKQIAETETQLDFIIREIAALNQKRLDLEQELRAADMSLAANDAHRLYEEINGRIKRLEHDRNQEEQRLDRYRTTMSQCEVMLGRPLAENFDDEAESIAAEAQRRQDAKYAAAQKKDEAAALLQNARAELSDIERGILRYPNAPRELRAALENAGIEAFFLAEAADISDPDWVDAVEGWLNTRRFALLVNPAVFQKALEVYNSLPRSVAGAFIPNIEKMRNTAAKPGSLAEIVAADGYARIYINYTLGKVMRADLASLKQYDSAVTKECMTYSNHTASRIKEETYRRHYLGQAALEERRHFLVAETARLALELSAAEREGREAADREYCCNQVLRSLPLLKEFFPAIAKCAALDDEVCAANEELAAIDTTTFKELEEKRRQLEQQLSLLQKDNDRLQAAKGGLDNKRSVCRDELDRFSQSLDEREEAVKKFGSDFPLRIGECESYAAEKLAVSSITELSTSYESTLKNFKTRTDTLKKEYSGLVAEYEQAFNTFLNQDPSENGEAEILLKRLEMSELPEYREKIARAYQDAEKEFKDHFISRLNEHIEEANASFDEINDILRTLHFGRDQYYFDLQGHSERKGHIEVIRQAAKIPSMDEGLFSQLVDPAQRRAAQELFDRILNAPLDSRELREICDYRTYFHYDIIIKETDTLDKDGNMVSLSLSRVLKEKSGGESQTPYYVAIAASFYRFYKARPETTARLVIFDEAFNRMDDERIGKILTFYCDLNLQIIASVPPEKIEAIGPYMDRINVISRFGNAVKIRDCHIDDIDVDIDMPQEAGESKAGEPGAGESSTE
ncbi:MAG: AAA family ATPase [Spirochaetaceae bacterium]|nr:AAA family ATPase [Spirochaetaceae bacterium]